MAISNTNLLGGSRRRRFQPAKCTQNLERGHGKRRAGSKAHEVSLSCSWHFDQFLLPAECENEKESHGQSRENLVDHQHECTELVLFGEHAAYLLSDGGPCEGFRGTLEDDRA
jgi:hypothetical protein